MAPQTPDGAVLADIAVLKNQQDALQRAVEDSRASNARNFGELSAKFDIVTDLMRELTRLQERSDSHGSGLERAHERCSELDGKISQLSLTLHTEISEAIDEHESRIEEIKVFRSEWIAEHNKVHQQIEARHNLSRGVIAGVGAVYALLLGFLVWGGVRLIDRIDHNSAAIKGLELDYTQQTGKLPRTAPR